MSTAESVSLDETAPSPSFPEREQPAIQEREPVDNSSEEDDTMSYFAKLAQQS